jgi:hypothetical protein
MGYFWSLRLQWFAGENDIAFMFSLIRLICV